MTSTTVSPGGLPLDEYNRNVPPGFKPGIPDYPVSVYMEKFRLWYKQTDLPAECVGPVMVGRLKLGAYRLAVKIRVQRQDGRVLSGEDAISAPKEDATTDHLGNAIPATPSGVQTILAKLQEAYGHLGITKATKLRNYLWRILNDTKSYEQRNLEKSV